MKKAIQLLILLISFSFRITAQTDSVQIEKIKASVNEIRNNIQNLNKIEKFRDSAGTRNMYFKDKALQVVIAEAQEHNTRKKIEWFFINDQMIYCEQKWIVLPDNHIFNSEKIYVHNGHIIRWIRTDGSSTPPSSPEFKETDFYLNEYGMTLLKESKN